MSDYWKTVQVIKSCKTSAQNNVAYKMIMLYERKYPQNNGLAENLYELCDENLSEIMEQGRQE